jgi:subtilisin family serine protease
MKYQQSSRARAGALTVALVLGGALAALPGQAVAMRASGNLSLRLAKLASPALREAPPPQQARAVGLSPGGLVREGRRVLAKVRFAGGVLAARQDLREAGATPLDSSRRYQTVTVSALPAQLSAIARVPGVEGVTPVLSPITAATCPSGSIVSEGDVQLKAKAAREANSGLNGSGTTVGILSDSFNQATEEEGSPIATKAPADVKSADLPGVGNECGFTTPVSVLKKEADGSEAGDEGRAMAQIVHDLAPGAKLDFASAFNGEEAFAESIRELAAAGAEVIADDVFYFEEPFFQEGPVAVAVKEVTEAGVSYFSAAGNDNLIGEGGDDIASWETPGFRDSGSCPPAVEAIPGANGSHCLDFNPGAETDPTFGIRVEPESTLAVDLQWDEPWGGVNTDLDAYLLNASGVLLPKAEAHEDNIDVSQTPVEVLEWTNSSSSTKTVQLAVNRFAGGTPRVKFALLENGGGVEATEYPHSSGEDVVGPTIFGHSASASAISVAAVRSTTKAAPEFYSSRGPVRYDFGPVESNAVAEPLKSPVVLSKPDLTATDCVRTTFFAFFDNAEFFPEPGWYFCGTSAAAPHAAAVAALMLQKKPSATPEDIRDALLSSAVKPFNPKYGPCAIGDGLVEAVGAVEKVLAPTTPSAPACEPPESEVDPEEARAPGNWGSEAPPSEKPTGSTTTPTQTPPVENPSQEEEQARVVRPRTFILRHPAKVIRTRHREAKAVFRFGSNEPGVAFACRVDGGFFRPCGPRLARLFPVGWHVVKVAAHDGVGDGDKTPASYRFKVKRVR